MGKKSAASSKAELPEVLFIAVIMVNFMLRDKKKEPP
jgi:hypothetical protein